MYKRKLTIGMMLLLVTISILSLSFSSCRKTDENSYKIGALFTLTGGTAYWSEQLKKVISSQTQRGN